MKKIELIRAIFILNDLNIINNAYAFKCVKEILDKTITGTNKNYDKINDKFLEEKIEIEEEDLK